MKRPPIRAFKRASLRAITGPPETPLPETRAQRVRNLARSSGAVIELIDSVTFEVRCEDKESAQRLEHRVMHACALVGVATYTWKPRGPDAPLTFLVELA